MTKLAVCAVFDSALAAYGRPLFVPAVGAAIRSFTDEANSKDGQAAIALHPEDYTLWQLAFFDDETGEFITDGVKRSLARGKDVVIAKE